MSSIIYNNNNIILCQMERYSIDILDIAKMTIEFLFNSIEDANKNYLILKDQINNTIQIKIDNQNIINLHLNRCHINSNKIIMKGQVL